MDRRPKITYSPVYNNEPLPLDYKMAFFGIEDMKDVRGGRPLSYYPGMPAIDLKTGKWYVWQEWDPQGGVDGVIDGGFTYPYGTISKYGIDVSGKTFNFVKFGSSIEGDINLIPDRITDSVTVVAVASSGGVTIYPIGSYSYSKLRVNGVGSGYFEYDGFRVVINNSSGSQLRIYPYYMYTNSEYFAIGTSSYYSQLKVYRNKVTASQFEAGSFVLNNTNNSGYIGILSDTHLRVTGKVRISGDVATFPINTNGDILIDNKLVIVNRGKLIKEAGEVSSQYNRRNIATFDDTNSIANINVPATFIVDLNGSYATVVHNIDGSDGGYIEIEYYNISGTTKTYRVTSSVSTKEFTVPDKSKLTVLASKFSSFAYYKVETVTQV